MLRGELTGLRAIEPEDLKTLQGWRNSPELRHYFREYRELSYRDQQRWYESLAEDRTTAMFVIVAGSQLIGAAGLCNIDWLRRSAELSLYLANGYVDDRFAPDAAKALLAYAFEDVGLYRAWAEIYDYDDLKRGLLEQLNFTEEGRLRSAHFADGRYYDTLCFGLLAPEYFENGERRA